VAEEHAEAADHRYLHIGLDGDLRHGLVGIDGVLDLADALALEAAITAKAHQLLDTDPTLPLDVRRSMAAGQLGSKSGREVVIYTHLDPQTGLAQVENTRSIIAAEQVAEWCTAAGTKVTVKPVVDLREYLHTESYEPTPALREQVILTHPTCVFPWCSRPSRRCDLDHILEYHRGGLTDSLNLAPLCRGHHRLKTHGGWTYRRIGPTSFEWTSPYGRRHIR
jgi:hypothetical protein